MSRFYTAGRLDSHPVELEGAEAHHLLHVLRLREGDQVELFDGRGGTATARIVATAKRRVQLQVLDRWQSSKPAVPVVLGSCVPKGDRFRWLVEKATELGVDRLIPLTTARSVVDPRVGKLEKMRQAVIAASKQCGRSHLMEVSAPRDWGRFVANEMTAGPAFVADPHGQPWGAQASRLAQSGPVVLAVGPEGGLTDDEICLAVDAGAHRVSLGPHVLRVETAAIALASFACLTAPGAPHWRTGERPT